MHISHHNGSRTGDVNDTDWQEAQVRQGVEPRDDARFVPYPSAEWSAQVERFDQISGEAREEYDRLGALLNRYIAIRDMCRRNELDEVIQNRAQELIETLMPQHEAAKQDYREKLEAGRRFIMGKR